MKIKFNSLLIITGFIIAMYSGALSAQNQSIPSLTTVESVVVDENGNPVAGAIVRGNEGDVFTRTDNMGRFTISVSPISELFIEAEGFESSVLLPVQYTDVPQLQLTASPLLEGERNNVNIAFDKISRKNIANAVNFINPEEIMGYDNIKSVGEALSGRVLGMYGGSNIRGMGSPLYVVDGLPRNIDNVDISEIEQITVLKDVNSSILYGSRARNGVVLISTKRGKAFKKDMKVTGYYGANKPLAMPEYLSSAEYMELYNEARVNDGFAPNYYSEETIENYRSGNPYRYPNIDYFSSDYVKQIKPFWKTMLELSGGNAKSRYYVNAGWEHSGSYLNFGEGKKEQSNAFNVRGNVDMSLSSWITTSLDASVYFYNTRQPRGSFWGDAHSVHPHNNVPLLPIDMMDTKYESVREMLETRKNDVNGRYLLGGHENLLTNSIAHGYSAGYVERFARTFSFNNRMNFDLGRVTEGLSFHTNINFDFYTIFDQAIQNEYAVYQATWDDEKETIIGLQRFGKDARPGVHYAGNSFYNRRIGIYGMFDYNRTFNEDHEVKASLLGYTSNYDLIGNYQGEKDYTAGLRVNYTYLNKYVVDFSSAYVISSKLARGNRGGFSPSVGLAWLISEEDFMESASSVDYLKLRLSAGILNSDVGIGGFFMHTDRYGSSGGYNWYDETYYRAGTVSVQGVNPKMGYEKYRDVNFGFDGQFFNRRLTAEANLFYKSNYDLLARPTTIYPSFYTDFIPYENFGENTYHGFEAGLRYKEKVGDFRFEIGGNLVYTDSKIKKRDEIFDEEYRYREGTWTDGRWGLVADGYFVDQDDIDNHAVQGFGVVRPGDIKYVDQNGDGEINASDEVLIGRWQAPWLYGLNLKLSYKDFTLFVHGMGQVGADSYLSGDYYQPRANSKYSAYARNRWTEDNPTAILPRLTTGDGSNNYQTSTFWQYKDNYFNINRVQLTYNLPNQWVDNLKMQNIDLFVDSSNPYTFSKYRKIRNTNTSWEPNSWNFSVGVKATF